MSKLFDISKEWAIIKKETLERKPTSPISEHQIEIRENLLKAQVLLAKIEQTKDKNTQIYIVNEYKAIKDRYFFLVSSEN